ncbi:hypothetical protein Leryth_023202 [Lithospermum erythrorhizon]|nr:hypothetical protein Leryth_023202 [Lithospermum erythrorhizon]
MKHRIKTNILLLLGRASEARHMNKGIEKSAAARPPLAPHRRHLRLVIIVHANEPIHHNEPNKIDAAAEGIVAVSMNLVS